MALEWHDPYPLVNPQTRADQQSQQLNQTLLGIGHLGMENRQFNKTNSIAQAEQAIRQQAADRQRKDWERENTGTIPTYGDQSMGGGGIPDMTPQGTQSWSPSPLDSGPQPAAQAPNYQAPSGPSSYLQMADAGTPDTGYSSMPQSAPQQPQMPQAPQALHQPGTDLTAHFNAWKAQGGGPYTHPEMSGMPSNQPNPMTGQPSGQNPMGGMDWNTYRNIPGSNNRAEYRLFQDEARKQREEQDRYGTGANGLYSTPDQAAFQMSPHNPKEQETLKAQMMKLYPDGRVPKSAIGTTASAIRLDVNQGEHAGQLVDKRLTALGDALDPSKQKAGAFGISKQVYDRAERLESLASAYKDGNLDSRQVEELAIGLNAMLSGSNTGAQQQVKSLVPNTIWGNAQKIKEWLANEPQGLQQQSFVNRMLGSITREKSTASDQIKRTQFQRIGRYANLEISNPDGFLNVLQSAGVDPEEYHQWKKGGYKPMSAVQSPEGQGGKIRVSNGKETLLIDPADAAEAAKDGYR